MKNPLKIIATLLSVLFLTAAPGGAGETLTHEIQVSSGGRLELDLKTGGSIKITGWNQSTVAVEATILGPDADLVEFEVKATRNGVRITSRFTERRRRTSSNIRIKVQVPLTFDIDIDTMGGGVTIRDVEGRISGKTMGGDLTLSNLKGELDLTTMGGDVEVVDSELDGKVSTMGGRVTLRDIYGDLEGTSMGGNVSLENVTRRDGSSTGSEVIISTMGGAINVDEAPEGADLHTMGGKITVRSASLFVKAETMGGDIEIDAVDGWVKATTMGGDLSVTMVGDPNDGERGVELVSMSGDVTLTVPDGLSMTIDVEIAYTRNHTKSGSFTIDSDFPLEESTTREWDYDHGTPRKYIRGRASVDGGTHRVKIRTINGNVVIKRGR